MALSGHSNTVIRCLLLGGKSDILAPERHSGSVGRELPFHVQAVAPCYVFLAAVAPCYVFLANDVVATSSVPRNPADVAALVPDTEKEPDHA